MVTIFIIQMMKVQLYSLVMDLISYQDGVIRPGYREELTTWARSVLDDSECRADLEDGYREMLILDAIIQSAKTDKEIVIPEES